MEFRTFAAILADRGSVWRYFGHGENPRTVFHNRAAGTWCVVLPGVVVPDLTPHRRNTGNAALAVRVRSPLLGTHPLRYLPPSVPSPLGTYLPGYLPYEGWVPREVGICGVGGGVGCARCGAAVSVARSCICGDKNATMVYFVHHFGRACRTPQSMRVLHRVPQCVCSALFQIQ